MPTSTDVPAMTTSVTIPNSTMLPPNSGSRTPSSVLMTSLRVTIALSMVISTTDIGGMVHGPEAVNMDDTGHQVQDQS